MMDLTGKMENMLELMVGLTKRMDRFESKAAGGKPLPPLSPVNSYQTRVPLSPAEADDFEEDSEDNEARAPTSRPAERISRPSVPNPEAVNIPNTQPALRIAREEIKEEEPVMDDSSSIPIGHSTAAHKLLKTWPSIAPFYRDVILPDQDDYVIAGEMERGLLKLYGRGEAHDRYDGVHTPGYGVDSPERDSSSPAPAHSEGDWGVGFGVPGSIEIRRSEENSVGGLNPDGTLKLDAPSVYRHFESFMENIHILHPILDKGRIKRMIDRFVKRYSPSPPSMRSPFAVSGSGNAVDMRRDTSSGSKAPKRKRSIGTMSGIGSAAAGDFPTLPVKLLPERSISNAIVLLVLALGNICEHREPLPGVVGEWVQPAGYTGTYMEMESPHFGIRPSPTVSHASSHSRASPNAEGLRYHGHPSRNPSTDSVPARDIGVKNVDRLPGLAYYAYATDILGNLHGGNDLSHTQALLLAGLYAGQLARVAESWTWIHSACRACQVLVRP